MIYGPGVVALVYTLIRISLFPDFDITIELDSEGELLPMSVAAASEELPILVELFLTTAIRVLEAYFVVLLAVLLSKAYLNSENGEDSGDFGQ